MSEKSITLSESLPELLRGTRAVEVLERSLTQNRLGHGILLHGDSLDSLETIVRAIAAHLLETKRDPFEHADCFTLRPSGKARLIKVGKTEDNNTMRKLVVFPQPDGPSNVRNSPSLTVRLRSATAQVSP